MATNVGYMNMYIEAIAILLKYKTDWLLLCCSEIKLQVPLMTFKAFPGLTVSSHINLTYSLLLYASHSSPAAPAYWSCSCLRTTVLPNSPVHSPLPLNICMAYSPRLFASTIIKPIICNVQHHSPTLSASTHCFNFFYFTCFLFILRVNIYTLERKWPP